MSRNWLPFQTSGTPVVRVRIRKSWYSALIDTGAVISMVAPDISIVLGLPTAGVQQLVGVTGETRTAPVVQLPEIGFGAMKLPPCRAAVLDVKRLGLKIELILGVNAFKGRRVQFDFSDNRIYILE
jgi:hypothetical protein